MGDELTLLLEVFHKIEKAGGQATLSVATVGGKTKVKLEIATNPAPPTGSTPTSSLTGRRHRRRSARARARRNQRAAAHQAALAEAATRASLDRPPPRPLRLLPSPPPESGRRQVTAVARPDAPTFSTLNVDGPSSPPPPPQPPFSTRPPFCYSNCEEDHHCPDCGRCAFLCIEHYGCHCDPNNKEEDCRDICAVCECQKGVR